MELSKAYNPKEVEEKIYHFWEKKGYFTPKIDKKKQPFVIVMPPPNVTGELHMGHALTVALEDLFTRFWRMQQIPTLWLPGTDHAGIATQLMVERELKKEGLSRQQLGREKFLERVWQWKEKYGGVIIRQLRRLGASCDWTRERFTMDKEYSQAVLTAFVELYKAGLIYKGDYIVNWCPSCQTVISDLEVSYVEEEGKLWYIKYPLKISNFQFPISKQNSKFPPAIGFVSGEWQAGKTQNLKFITVATTRPETMLGDTAVAVNPNDKRYKDLIGQTVILPLVGRQIPIIADRRIDPDFGTGVLKVTPAHDKTDYEIGKEHKLEIISVIGKDGQMTKGAGKNYQGLTVTEARKKIIEDLKTQGLLEKEEKFIHNVGHCYRCNTVIEPLVSKQWFVKIKPLAKPAIQAVKDKKIKFIPQRFEKIYLNWLENIQDWCISRQLWWGHRLPVWYCQTGKISNSRFLNPKQIQNPKFKAQNSGNTFVVSPERPKKCPICGECEMMQDPDVLDTWFSSALWPFATLGWPLEKLKIKNKKFNPARSRRAKISDLDYFYPTTLMETGYDILFFWVARMVMMGLFFMNEVPFKYVYLHGLVRDIYGQKMSKTKGNIIEPLEVAEKYGTDALRYALVTGNAPGNDLTLSLEKIEGAKRFVNKIWNASRFVFLSLQDRRISTDINADLREKTQADKEILEKLDKLIKSVTDNYKNYKPHLIGEEIHEFFWHEFCDKYLEISKTQLKDKKLALSTQQILIHVLVTNLKLLHPLMPFVTEEIYQILRSQIKEKKWPEALMISEWPSE